MRYNGVTGNIFTPDIGPPQGDCACPIWFIFYLHKAILAANVNFEISRNILSDIKHDHTNVNKDSFTSDNEKDHSYTKSITPKGNCGFLTEQQCADDASWATNIKTVKESVKKTAPSELKCKNLIVKEDKTEDYCIQRTGDQSWTKYRFLGSLLGNKEDINRRKQLACETFNIYKPALCSNKISFKLRIRVLQTLIPSTFLYNSELWCLSKAQNNKLGVFQIIFSRQIIRNRKISNSEIYRLCNIEPWSNEIKHRSFKWFGHLVRLPETAPAKQTLAEARKPFKKLSGGQPTTWLSTIKKYFS